MASPIKPFGQQQQQPFGQQPQQQQAQPFGQQQYQQYSQQYSQPQQPSFGQQQAFQQFQQAQPTFGQQPFGQQSFGQQQAGRPQPLGGQGGPNKVGGPKAASLNTMAANYGLPQMPQMPQVPPLLPPTGMQPTGTQPTGTPPVASPDMQQAYDQFNQQQQMGAPTTGMPSWMTNYGQQIGAGAQPYNPSMGGLAQQQQMTPEQMAVMQSQLQGMKGPISPEMQAYYAQDALDQQQRAAAMAAMTPEQQQAQQQSSPLGLLGQRMAAMTPEQIAMQQSQPQTAQS